MNSENNKNRKSSSHYLKWFLGGLLIIAISFGLIIYVFLDIIVKKRIINGVHSSTEGLYILEIADLDAHFWTGAITMKEVWLKPDARDLLRLQALDSNATIPNVNFHFDSVNIASIKWFKYLMNNEKLEIGIVLIDHPDFIIHSEFKESKSIKAADKNFLDLLPGIIAAFTGSLRIEEILIKNGHLHYDLHGKTGIVHQLADSIHLDLKAIVIDTIAPQSTLYSEEAFIEMRNYSLTTPDNLHSFLIKHISGAVHDSTLNLVDIVYSQKDSIIEKYKDGIFVSMEKIETRGVDYGSLLKEQKIFIRAMELKSPDVELHSSEDPVKKYTEKKSQENEPTILDEIVPYLSGSFRIDTLAVDNGKIYYEILNQSKYITQQAHNIYLDFSRVLVDTTVKGSDVFAENAVLKLKNYRLRKGEDLKLEIASLHASLSDSLLRIKNLSLMSKNGDSYFIAAKDVNGKGIDYRTMLENKKAHMRSLVINSPKIKMTNVSDAQKNKVKKSYQSPKFYFQDALGPLADASFSADKLIVRDGDISQQIEGDSGLVEQKVKNACLTLRNVRVDSSSAEKYSFFDSFVMGARDYELKVHNKNLKLEINNIRADSRRENIVMKNISFSQLRSFGALQRHYYINSIKKAIASGFDYNRLIQKQEVHMSSLDVSHMSLEIFLDASKSTMPDYMHHMPNELIKKIDLYVRIDTMNVRNSYISYSDQEPGVKEPGMLTFEKINIGISNLTNDKKLMTDSTPAYLKGTTLLMGEGMLDLYFKMPLLSEKFNAQYGGTMGPMLGTNFNKLLRLTGIQVETGEILPSKFEVDIINGTAFGEIEFIYQDLHVQMLDKNEDEKKRIMSLLANFVIKNHNPNDKGEEPEKVNLSARRTEEDSFFYFLWRIVRGGIAETVTKSTVFKVDNEK